MNIIDVITKIDLNLLVEQSRTVEKLAAFYAYHGLTSEEKEHLEGVLELIDNIICGLQEV